MCVLCVRYPELAACVRTLVCVCVCVCVRYPELAAVCKDAGVCVCVCQVSGASSCV